MVYVFGDCELDSARVQLRRQGVEVRLEPQVFDLLLCLLEHRGEVVRKEQLLDEVWRNRFVSDSALTTRVKSARQAVGDDGSRQHVIRTVHGRGYQFVADVEVVEAAPPAAPRPSREPSLAPPAPPAVEGPTSRLPASVQPLIGRAELLDRLGEAIAEHRLLTLAGTGGVGKTSVGYELARRVEADYVDGVYAVELVTVVDEDATLEAVATALDVNTRQQLSIEDAIVDMLRPRRALLLLDNCEHVVEVLAALVNRILRAAPRVSIIATSREALAVASEQVWTIEPLPFAATPSATGVNGSGAASGAVGSGAVGSGAARQGGEADLAQIPAVALFVERAVEADPGFRLDESTAPAVMEICARLDGIPLAIELAAARVRATDVAEIARRLDERFRFLKGVRRGADPRHRTLEDAVSWSYDLLAPEERRLFASLAVFAGPFDLDAVGRICGDGRDVLDSLTRLTERSMLAVRRPSGGGTRYELLETLREYGRGRLDDHRSVELFAAHAAYYASLARSVEAGLQTPLEPQAVARADAAFADLRSAQRFALQIGDVDTAAALIGSTREYAMRTMHYEVFTWADMAVRLDSRPDRHDSRPDSRLDGETVGEPERPPLLTAITAYGAWVRGEFETAVALAREARRAEEACGAVPSGLVERVLGNVLGVVGDVDAGWNETTRQLALAEESGNASRLAHACYMASVYASSMGDYSEADHLIDRARQAGQRTGSPTDLASAAVAEGFAAQGDDRAALDAFSAAERLARAAGNRWMSAFAHTEASGLLVLDGVLAAGCAGLADMVDIWYRAGEWSQQWQTLARCVIALERIDQPELATQVVGAIETHAALGRPPVMVTLRDQALGTREVLERRLGVAQVEDLLRQGAALPVVDVVHRTREALLGRSGL